jgi:hypothetical protein
MDVFRNLLPEWQKKVRAAADRRAITKNEEKNPGGWLRNQTPGVALLKSRNAGD